MKGGGWGGHSEYELLLFGVTMVADENLGLAKDRN